MQTETKDQVSFRTKFWFGVGASGESTTNWMFNALTFIYYQQILGLSGTLTGAAVLIGILSDAVTDPVMGSISDSFRSRFGRRHLFMFAAPIPLAASIFLIFNPPVTVMDDQALLGRVAYRLAYSDAVARRIVAPLKLVFLDLTKLVFGRLTWEAIPYHEPILLVTFAAVVLGGVALLGTGPQALAHFEAISAVRQLARVHVWGRNAANAAHVALASQASSAALFTSSHLGLCEARDQSARILTASSNFW